MADCLRCALPVNFGHSFVSSAKLGGQVHLECMTDEDSRKVWPERMERADQHRAALKFIMATVHDEKRCRYYCTKFNLLCPVHDRDENEEE